METEILTQSLAGEKNIYYNQAGQSSDTLADFRSSSQKINTEAIFDFLLYGAVLPPQTIFPGAYSLFPGETLSIRGNLPKKENILFQSLAQIQPLRKNVDYFVSQLDSQLQNYFDALHASGKKICLFLSGGVDSGILASYLRPEDFCITWAGWGKQTSDYLRAQKTAAHYNLKNHLVVFPDYDQDEKLFASLSSRHLEPFKLAAISYYRMADKIKNTLGSEVVCVTGDNADTLAGSFGEVVYSYRLSRVSKITRFFPWHWFYYKYRKLFLPSTDNPVALSAWLHSGGLFPSHALHLPADYFDRKKSQAVGQFGRPLSRFNDYILAGMLLTGVVRQMSGVRSIIGRELGVEFSLPFCVEGIVRLFLSVPDNIRQADHYGKIILKKLAAERGLPADFINQPKKGMSYGHLEYLQAGRHIPIWQAMEKNNLLNQFVDVKLARRRLENNFSVFDALRSLYYYLNSNFPT